MLKHFGALFSLSSSSLPSLPIFSTGFTSQSSAFSFSSSINDPKPARRRVLGSVVHARRRVIYDDENEGGENGYNTEIEMLEVYSQSVKGEALLVKAAVDEEEVEVLIFKGFSSSLSYGTSADLTKSVLPAKAKIKCVDRIRGPFNPSNIEYIERDISWEAFKTRL